MGMLSGVASLSSLPSDDRFGTAETVIHLDSDSRFRVGSQLVSRMPRGPSLDPGMNGEEAYNTLGDAGVSKNSDRGEVARS